MMGQRNLLTWREREVIKLRKDYTVVECARILKTTVGRIRSIEGKARGKQGNTREPVV